ncbi:MAG: hypothetical protein IJQ80_02985, partial [Clostridia bacterium]|nr:hypothetical protein [Clostridia bacterium]
MKKRFASFVLCLIMLASCAAGAIPVTAAEGAPTEEARSIYDQYVGTGSSSDPYIINTWADFDYYMRDPGTISVKLNRDIEWKSKSIDDYKYWCHPIDVTGNIVLDLNGHSIVKYNRYESAGGGNGGGELLNVKGSLTVNDSVGTGLMNVKGYLKENYILAYVEYNGRENVITADNGGHLEINGGNFIAGQTKELYCAGAYVAESEGWHSSYLDSTYYDGKAWRVDSGTAITAKTGSTVIIRAGAFTGIGYQDLFCETFYTTIDKKQAALEINPGSVVKIYGGFFHGDGGANIINYKGGSVDVYVGTFTQKCPRIIVGQKRNSLKEDFRVEYDTSKHPGTVNLPRSCFEEAEAAGGVFLTYGAPQTYDPKWVYDSLEFVPSNPLYEPNLEVGYVDPTKGTSGKIEWAPGASRKVYSTGANKYFPEGSGMYEGESSATDFYHSGFEWCTYDEANIGSFITVHTEDEQFDLRSFETGQDCRIVEKTAGFEFKTGHTYFLRCRHYLEYKGTYTYSDFFFADKFLVLEARVPKVKLKYINNTWERAKAAPNWYVLEYSVSGYDPSTKCRLDFYVVASDGTRKQIQDNYKDLRTTVDSDGSVKMKRFRDTGDMLTPGAIVTIAADVTVTDGSGNT